MALVEVAQVVELIVRKLASDVGVAVSMYWFQYL